MGTEGPLSFTSNLLIPCDLSNLKLMNHKAVSKTKQLDTAANYLKDERRGNYTHQTLTVKSDISQ